MSNVLLQTKLNRPPLRSSLISRTHLANKLSAGLNRKLTLVSAPPGFGKTTLVSSWIQQLDRPAAWLSLDNRDNEPYRFLRYLIAALQRVHRDLGETTVSLLQSPQSPPLDTLLTLLINDLSSLDLQVVLVLDDYHVINNSEIHGAINYLLDNQPPQLHLVIISREDPVLPLHRLRGSGQMSGIYVRDLRFSTEEATTFLNETMGLGLSSEEVSALGRRTEGWVAGLQLAALSMHEASDPRAFLAAFAGDDRYITDYLMAEVIKRQPPAIREFLLRTAMFDRFCAPLCEAIAGAEELGDDSSSLDLSSQAIIDHLDQANLFIIPLDHKRQWYRYHHLFAEFLRLRSEERPAVQMANLHRRAAAWYAEQGFTEDSIQHSLAAKDYDRAANLIESVGIRLIVQGKLREMIDWLAQLPDDFIATRPLLCVCHAWALSVAGRAAASEVALQKAEQLLETAPPEGARRSRGLIDLLRAYRSRRQDDLPSSIQFLSQAVANLPSDDLLVRSGVNLNLGFNYLLIGQLAQAVQVLQLARQEGQAVEAVYISLIAMAVQANSHVAQGKLRLAIKLYEEAIDYGLAHNRGQPFPPAGYAYAGLGQVLYERNQVSTAEQLLTLTAQLGESIADWSMVRRGLLPLAWLKQIAGEPDMAQKLWEQAAAVVQQAGSERIKARMEAQWIRLQLARAPQTGSTLNVAIEWAEAYRQHEPDATSYQEAPAQMTLAQVELAQGRIDQAITRLTRLAEAAAAGGHNENLIRIRALQALAYDARGDKATALDRLARALALAAPEGYVRTFVDFGPPMQHLLRQAAVQGSAADYATCLLAAFPEASQGESPSSQPTSSPTHELLLEPLTERELSMVRLMAAGLSNHEIGNELFLSVNTVKAYATRIYNKLDVHRRGEAVARAQELGLI